jgi:mono/diheme cytochrome c family protein
MQLRIAALSLIGAWAIGFPNQINAQQRGAAAVPRGLSAFSKSKAESLLQGRLPCLGCHQLAGQGGRIGPDLTTVAQRRSAAYVKSMIEDPQHTVPGVIMPRVPMSQATLDLIVSYLASSSTIPQATTPKRPALSAAAKDTASGRATYARYCAACHGQRGGGDGFNARNLPQRPTVHADPKYMSTRTDDELFDAIAAGGYVMNRSNRMPPFGETLSREQIWKLVQYLRELCRCQGPAWGRDSR